MKKKIIINTIELFKNKLNKQKIFKNLSKQYKSDKFIALYYRIYNYSLEIPREKIAIGCFVNTTERHYISNIFNLIYHFIEAKDFYNWRNRIYSLLTTEKLGVCLYKYKLLYGSKAKEFLNQYRKKLSTSKLNRSDENKRITRQKTIKTLEEKYGKGITCSLNAKIIREKTLKTLEKHYGAGITNPMQSKEVQEKHKRLCFSCTRKA